MRGTSAGFSLLEVLIAVAIAAILVALAVPSFEVSLTRDQIVTAVPLANIAKKPIEAMWSATQSLPADNAAAGLPAAEKIVNNTIRAIAVQDGAIHITFGNSARAMIAGKVLSLRPAVVEDAPVVPVAWVCGFAPTPGNMIAKGENRTDVPVRVLPFNCQGNPGN
jgi:type IV pilus assembly protein PilA